MIYKHAKNDLKNIIFNLVCIFLIIIFPLLKLNNIYLPWIYDDEIGYWGQAAFLVGKNWSEILQYSDYYSFGYGFILAPLMFFIQKPILLYRVAIVLNIFFIIISYYLAKRIIRKMCDLMEYQVNLIAIMAVLTGNVILGMTNTLVESLLVFLDWLLIYILIKNIQKITIVNTVLCACILVFMYMVHMRTIGILAVYIIFIIFFSIREKNNKLAWSLILIMGGILITALYKSYTQDAIWGNLPTENIHADATGFKSHIIRALNLIASEEGRILFFKNLIGKIFYFSISSFFFLFLVTKNFYIRLKRCLEKKTENKDYIYMFIYISFLAELVISVISTAGGIQQRSDYILYGRYAENAFGPIVMLGFIDLWEKGWHLRKRFWLGLIWVGSFFSLLACIINIYFSKKGVSYFTYFIINVAEFIAVDQIEIIKLMKYICLLILVFCIYYFFNKSRVMHKFSYVWLSIFVLLVGFSNADTEFNKDVLPWQKQKESVIEAIEFLKDYTEKNYEEEYSIYYLIEDIHNKDGNRTTIQFLLSDKKIQCLEYSIYSDVEKIPDGILICTPDNEEKVRLLSTTNLVYENKEIVILEN